MDRLHNVHTRNNVSSGFTYAALYPPLSLPFDHYQSLPRGRGKTVPRPVTKASPELYAGHLEGLNVWVRFEDMDRATE